MVKRKFVEDDPEWHFKTSKPTAAQTAKVEQQIIAAIENNPAIPDAEKKRLIKELTE